MKIPHQLSPKAIEDFKVIYQEEFGRRLTDEEMPDTAIRLLHLFGILVQPLTDEGVQKSL
jgi:hypothetical protein